MREPRGGGSIEGIAQLTSPVIRIITTIRIRITYDNNNYYYYIELLTPSMS